VGPEGITHAFAVVITPQGAGISVAEEFEILGEMVARHSKKSDAAFHIEDDDPLRLRLILYG